MHTENSKSNEPQKFVLSEPQRLQEVKYKKTMQKQ